MKALGDFHLPHFHFHLGLVPAESRSVKPMPESLRCLVPVPEDDNRTWKPQTPDTEKDTMPLLISKTKRTLWQSKKLADKLKGSSLSSTLQNDSNFILDYIKYKKDDPLHEQIRSPRRLVYEGAGDCDCFAHCLASLLTNQGIKFKFRITKYQAGDWGHIYLVVPIDQKKLSTASRADYIVLDPVTNKHNYEVPFKEHKDYDMSGRSSGGLGSLQYLDGLGCECGVPSTNKQDGPPQKIQVVGAKSLQIRGLESSENLIAKTGLPYAKTNDTSGNVVYNVSTPQGTKTVAGIIPISPAEQQKITNDLLAPAQAPTQANTPASNSQDITAHAKWAVPLLVILGVTTFALDSMRSKPSANGLGALPRKKIAYLKI